MSSKLALVTEKQRAPRNVRMDLPRDIPAKALNIEARARMVAHRVGRGPWAMTSSVEEARELLAQLEIDAAALRVRLEQFDGC
jgi:hypothetical protein